jgi:hypothetical protein
MKNKNEIVAVHKVNLGYDVEEEMERYLKEEISEEVLEDAKDLIDAISDRPGNKKAIEKITLEKNLEECCEIILKEGKISKDKLCEITGMTIYAVTNSMRSFASKNYKKSFKKLSRKEDDYGFED